MKTLYPDTFDKIQPTPQESERMRQSIQAASSDEKEVITMKKYTTYKAIIAIAAAVALLCTTAFAIDFVINQKQTLFFHNEEDLLAAQPVEPDGTATPYGTFDTEDYQEDLDGVAEIVALNMEGCESEDRLISDETGTDDTLWTRRVVREALPEAGLWYHTEEAYTADTLSDLTAIQSAVQWDVSWLEEHWTARADAQMLLVRYDAAGGLTDEDFTSQYRNESGGQITIQTYYAPTEEFGDEYYLDDGVTFRETISTADNVQVTVYGVGSGETERIYANATFLRGNVSLFTTTCSQEEVEDLVSHLKLATLAETYSK